MPRRSTRPPRLTEALALEICARLHAGQSLIAICEDPAMPSRSNLYRWRAADLAFDQTLQALLDAQVRPERRHPRKGAVSYTPELARAVLARLAAGESQKSVARDPAMPCVMTILKWTREVPGFAAARAQALARPRRYPRRRYAATSPERLDRLCLSLLDGAPLSVACRAPDVPSEQSIRRHARVDPEFRHAFAIARDMGQWIAAERMWEGLRGLLPDDAAGLAAAERTLGKERRRRRG